MSFNSYANCLSVVGTTTLCEAASSPLPFNNHPCVSSLQLNYSWEQANPLEFQYDASYYHKSVITKFASELIENMENISPRYGKLINKNFWDLF